MTMRITGMNSGLDTESIIQELVKAKKVKGEKLTKKKTSLEWKSDAWKELNTKIKTFYTNQVSNFRFSSSFIKKKTTVSNTSAATVITGDRAMNGVQTLSIDKLAKSGYMTGAELKTENGKAATGDTLVSELKGMSSLVGGKISVATGDTVTDIEIGAETKISEVVSKLQNAGVSANFDEKNQRLYIASASSGEEGDFALTATNEAGFKALSALGINDEVSAANKNNAKTFDEYSRITDLANELKSKYLVYQLDENGLPTSDVDFEATMQHIDVDSDLYKYIKGGSSESEGATDYGKGIASLLEKADFASKVLNGDYASDYSDGAKRIAGQDAEITLNGVTYKGETNNIEVNGLTITCLSEAKDITITTQSDTDGIYDMVRNFFTEYNKLINEFDKLYNAESAAKFEPLTDEEKDEMSDTEIEKWEKKIKDSLFRRDSTLGTLSGAMKDIMQKGFEVNGSTMYLSNFGINTMSYFLAPENEKNAFHIDGDDKDPETSGNADKLKTMIANDPDTVVSFFTQLSRELYKKMTDLSASSDDSSSGSFYNDKKIKSDLNSYTSKIAEAEKKLADYEDKYYKKFAAMEVALGKLQSSTSSITAMLGNGN